MENKSFKIEEKLMGNHFEFCILHHDEKIATELLNQSIQEVKRIEYKLTTFSEDSETALINAKAGIRPVRVSGETISLILRAQKLSQLTQGAFDLSYGSIDKNFWNFNTKMTSLPDPKKAASAVQLINYKNIIIDTEKSTVFLKNKGMCIGFGGIGKGYAADMVKAMLIKEGVQSGFVNASGDLITWGKQIDGNPWTIGITDPNSKLNIYSSLAISDRAVATSGDYEKYVIIDGKRYSHTIDPKTGFPISSLKSVTIISPTAEISDALATPVMVMGAKTGLHLINQITQVECILITDDDRVLCSQNIHLKN